MSKISRRNALGMLGATGAAIVLTPSFSCAGNKTIICGWDNAFPPYSMEKDGKMTGLLVDCVDEVLARRMGYTVEHRRGSWPKIQDLARIGKVNSLCTNPTKARSQFMLFCDAPVVASPSSIFCTRDNPKIDRINQITTLKDLENFHQVDYAGNGWAHQNFPPTLKITWADTLADAFKMIAAGKADIFVGNSLAAMNAMARLGLKDVIHGREFPVGEPSSFHFGLRRDYPDAAGILARFTETLDQAIVDDSIDDIIMNYL